MAYNYIVTAQEATAVNTAVTGHFTGPNDMNLIVAKNSQLEVHMVTPEGLEPKIEIKIYGRIATMQLFRPPVSMIKVLFFINSKVKKIKTVTFTRYFIKIIK